MYTTHRTVGSVIPVAVRHVSPQELGGSRSHARNSERGAAAQRARRSVSEVVAKYATASQSETPSCLGVDRRTVLRARMAARAPPRAPTLASHGLNVRCKKTYRATQRTNLLASVTL